MRFACLIALSCLTFATFSLHAKEDAGKPHVGSKAQPLSPEEAQKRFKVPDGFEVRLFAAEPDVINPVAMSFDEKGRLWVVELYEYPYERPKNGGRKGRDRVICLEDPDRTGHATRRTVVVEDLWLATGICFGNQGIYVGQAPDFYYYPITETRDGPKAGERQKLLTGFGLDDKHELLNGFTWGPDGWLYMTHGVFTHSKVVNCTYPDEPPIPFDAGVGRFNPYTKRFEVWCDGISNQWGIDWDAAGHAFVSACVVDHIWHVVPGGVFQRQGGVPTIPYTYGLLGPINKDRHRHHMAAYSGINIYQGNLFPPEYRGTAFMGNIHGNCLDHDKLTPDGSSFTATDLRKREDSGEFLEANDDWFRPVSTQTGPDGALWIIDWYDKYPCYQNSHEPDLDRERGRVWRVVYTGKEPGKAVPTRPLNEDLSTMTVDQLVPMLAHPNIWQRRTAQRLITERFRMRGVLLPANLTQMALNGNSYESRMAAIWTLGSCGGQAGVPLGDEPIPAVRAWTARFATENKHEHLPRIAMLQKLAEDKDPTVLAAVAMAARRIPEDGTTPIITTLIKQPAVNTDPQLGFLIWMATEPLITQRVNRSVELRSSTGGKVMRDALLSRAPEVLDALTSEAGNLPAAGDLARKIVRRVIDGHDANALSSICQMANTLADRYNEMAYGILSGLLEAQQKSGGKRPAGTEALDLSKFESRRDPRVGRIAQRLAAIWGNVAAAEAGLNPLIDAKSSEEQRLAALQLARELKTDMARSAVVKFLGSDATDALKLEAIRALGDIGGEDTIQAILSTWKSLTPAARRSAVEVLITRLSWTKALLHGIESKVVSPDDFSSVALRALSREKDEGVKVLMKKTIGQFRPADADKLAIIAAKKKILLDGSRIDYEAGHLLMQKTCLVCHTFYGEGAHVGPDLTGVGRSTIDALLHNVIDPNEIIGAGYENTLVETKDHRSLAGRMVENTDDHVKLLSTGDKEDIVAKSDIVSLRTERISVMPEGLVDTMPDNDLRNLLWYVYWPPQEHGTPKKAE